MQTETFDVRVRIEEDADLYVGEQARAAMQADAARQLTSRLAEASRLWGDGDELDISDIDAVKELDAELTFAKQAANALVALAPIPDDDDPLAD